jgi:hypothetical protein
MDHYDRALNICSADHFENDPILQELLETVETHEECDVQKSNKNSTVVGIAKEPYEHDSNIEGLTYPIANTYPVDIFQDQVQHSQALHYILPVESNQREEEKSSDVEQKVACKRKLQDKTETRDKKKARVLFPINPSCIENHGFEKKQYSTANVKRNTTGNGVKVVIDNPTDESLVLNITCSGRDMSNEVSSQLSHCIKTTRLPKGWKLLQTRDKTEITIPPYSVERSLKLGVATTAKKLNIKDAHQLLVNYNLTYKNYSQEVWTSLHTGTLNASKQKDIISKVETFFKSH